MESRFPVYVDARGLLFVVHIFPARFCYLLRIERKTDLFPVSLSLPEDVNVTAVVAAVVVVCLVILVCGCGGFLLHRNGFFSRESFLLQLHQI